jgi:hypothetical protein
MRVYSRDFFSSVTPVPVCTGINSGGGVYFLFILVIPLLSAARGAAEPPFANPAALQAAESLLLMCRSGFFMQPILFV